MTTAEAEYHADTMWPYFDSRVLDMIQDTLKQQVTSLVKENTFDALGDIVEINTSTPEGRMQLKSAFRLIRILGDLRQLLGRVCIKCLIPWTLAAAAGILGLIFKDNVPELIKIIQRLQSSAGL